MIKPLLLLLQFTFGSTLEFEKPVAKVVWQQYCRKNSHVLNDCNWCHCDKQHQFKCKARVCSEVDMFGHFNDAIQSINVGMEGHGSWRSVETACEPGVHYRRHNLLCVCNEDGNWPNPLCRDIFRILHSVEITDEVTALKTQECSPTKLYLVGCNICYCPSTGLLDSDMCTKGKCFEDDPLVRANDKKSNADIKADSDNEIRDIYAECKPDNHYKLGCKTCVCLRNNRLLCNNCSLDDNSIENNENYCSTKSLYEVFNIDCNSCYCDKNGLVICTTKRCLTGASRNNIEKLLSVFTNIDLRTVLVDSPVDDQDCIPGTIYKKECNTCKCIQSNGIKMVACTMKGCKKNKNTLESINSNCVKNTVYEMDCLYCRCDILNNEKWQWCTLNPECFEQQTENSPNDLNSFHGYCEPLHVYKKDCNTCQCLSNGKFMVCTSNICDKTPTDPVSIEVVPVSQKNGTRCPKQHSYKIDCNYCYCLSNGNALCSTVDCNKNNVN